MKLFILHLLILVTVSTTGYTQPKRISYGVEASQYFVNSGFGSGTELGIFVQDENNRRLSISTYFDHKINTLGGISTSFTKSINLRKINHRMGIDPYFFYKFFYRHTTISDTLCVEDCTIEMGTYKSMEHYAGFGIRKMITEKIYLTSEIGYGLYLGSIFRPSEPHPALNTSHGTNGGGLIIQAGIGFSL